MAKAESFRDFIGSIQKAFIAVNELGEQQHLEMLAKYFDGDGKPRTMRVKYPAFGESGEITYNETDIPLLCLVPISSLKLNEIDINFKVKLSGKIKLDRSKYADNFSMPPLQTSQNAPPEAAAAASGGDDDTGFIPEYSRSKSGSYADISLKFRAEEAPEGLMRIRDELIKILP